MKNFFRHILTLLIVVIFAGESCDTSDITALDNPTLDPEGDTPTELAKGFEEFSFELPLLSRFESFAESLEGVQVDVELFMKGRVDHRDYTLAARMSVEGDCITLSVEDAEALAQLPHQEYLLNYMSHNGATRSDTQPYPDDAVVIGAILSASNPEAIHLVSTFSESNITSGSGTERDPYIIVDIGSFQDHIVDPMTGGSTLKGLYFLQSGDLNFAGLDIGNIGVGNKTNFEGNYDGGMMKFSQLTINSISNDAAGLFYGIGEGGVFCNAIFDKSTLSGVSNVGMVAGYISGGEILHVFVNSGCTIKAEGYSVGGFVGSGAGTFATVVFGGSIIGKDGCSTSCGGIVGSSFSRDYNELKIINSVFSGSIKGASRVGGLVGDISDTDIVEIDGASISGTIEVEHDNGGGLIGSAEKVDNIKINSAHIGYLRTTNNDTYVIGSEYEAALVFEDYTDSSLKYVGGLIGYIEGAGGIYTNLSVTNSNFSENSGAIIECQSCCGGAIGYMKAVIIEQFDFTNNVDISSSYSENLYFCYVGGVFGRVMDTQFINSCLVNYGNISSAAPGTGGVIGVFHSDLYKPQKSLRLENYGNVTSTSETVGGCIGGYYNNLRLDPFITYINYGAVRGDSCVGGFIGSAENDICMVQETGLHKNGDSGKAYDVYISGGESVGGMIGELCMTLDAPDNMKLYGSSVCSVSSSGSFVGGILGKLYLQESTCSSASKRDMKLSFCEHGASTMNVSGMSSVGGFLGSVKIGIDNTTFTISTGSIYKDDNCSVISGLTTDTDAESFSGVGGIVGNVSFMISASSDTRSVKLDKCYNVAYVESAAHSAGGIVGHLGMDDISNLFIENCCNWGKVYSSVDEAMKGGILGYADWGSSAHIMGCYNAGEVAGGSNRGGIVGAIDDLDGDGTEIYCCFNMGPVLSGGNQVAGLVGVVASGGNHQKLTMRYSYNIGSTGYGTMGGWGELGKKDLENSNNYYLNTASSGDLDNLGCKYTGAQSLSASSMASGGMALDGKYYTTPGNMSSGYLPYLTNVGFYKSKPKVAL